jgi:DNA adenine methylase
VQYFGGKSRIAKPLSRFLIERLRPGQAFVDLFCGGCNIIAEMPGNRIRIANDINPYLIAMWKALQDGWNPPEQLTRNEYYDIKNNLDRDMALSAFVGFGCSFAGKWWGGVCQKWQKELCYEC